MPKKIKHRAKEARRSERVCGYALNRLADFELIQAIFDLLAAARRYRFALHIAEDTPEPDRSVNMMLCHMFDSSTEAASNMALLAGHGLWSGVFMLQRLCFEYRIRAQYCERDPDYAQWSMCLQYRRSELRHNDLVLSNKDKRRLGDELRRQERRFQHLSPYAREEQGRLPFHRITFSDMMDEALGVSDPENYRVQSMIMHGDPYAIVLMNTVDSAQANRALIDAANDILALASMMQSRISIGDIAGFSLDSVRQRITRLTEQYYGVDNALECNSGANAI